METYVDTGYCMMDAAWGAILQFTGEDANFGVDLGFYDIDGYMEFNGGWESNGPWIFETYAFKGDLEYQVKGTITKSMIKDMVFFVAECSIEPFLGATP